MKTLLEIRKFNSAGINEFSKLLDVQRGIDKAHRGKFPDALLTDTSFTEVVSKTKKVNFDQVFASSKELGDYIYSLLDGEDLYSEHGIWSWLACGFMDVIAPKPAKILENACYIPAEFSEGPMARLKMQRHRIRTPFEIVRKTKNGELLPDFAALALNKKPETHTSFVEQCFSNNKILRNKNIQNTILRLYRSPSGRVATGYDSHADKKNPASKKGAGGLRRCVKIIIPRIQENFDLQKMTTENFIDAWGPEIKGSRFYKKSP